MNKRDPGFHEESRDSPSQTRARGPAANAVPAAIVSGFPFVLTSNAAAEMPIEAGVIGCGGRGLGAVADLLAADKKAKIVALADLFEDRMGLCREQLKAIGVQVLGGHCFVGFDAYEKLLALPEINYVIPAAPPHFRPSHLRAALEAGKHVFMERPVAADGPEVRSVIESGELARPRGLSIVAGRQRRHRRDYQETIRSIRAGAPLNEARQIAESTLTAIMGREAAYSGQPVGWEQAFNSTRKLAPERYAFDAKPPRSLVAMPGQYKFVP